jgi:hypothetical protein
MFNLFRNVSAAYFGFNVYLKPIPLPGSYMYWSSSHNLWIVIAFYIVLLKMYIQSETCCIVFILFYFEIITLVGGKSKKLGKGKVPSCCW